MFVRFTFSAIRLLSPFMMIVRQWSSRATYRCTIVPFTEARNAATNYQNTTNALLTKITTVLTAEK